MLTELTIPAVIGAAIVDAINPCAFAVLIILIATILGKEYDRKKALLSGFAFSASIYISYFLMGMGLFRAIQISGLSNKFYFVISVLAIIIGLLNVKDYFWYGKGLLMEVPLSWRPRMKKLINSATTPTGAFFIGFAVSLFLLPCTSGPYIVILGLLAASETQFSGMLYLLFYNLIFVSPMIAITLIVYKGLSTTEDLENLRQKKLKHLHLAAGIIMILLGLGMLLAMHLGML
ncbi:MAG: hypothetical protein KAR87_03020 [Candidatus Aenigmarchaeota archaeon]|nr:hypothetical protein [Candidatus Aenigmarchaeota archaeon]